MATTVLLIRHGDRYDYECGREAWTARCKSSTSLDASDPPLSALGHKQARELAAHLAKEGVDVILVSPYLRALQTAQPLAHATGLPLLVDFLVAEAHQRPSSLPPTDDRLPYFPEIDGAYEPLMGTVVTDGPDGREPRLEHMRRMIRLSRELAVHPRFAGKTIAIFTHAASLALVAALTGAPSLEAAGKLAPCGACKLVLGRDGIATVAERGDDSSAYVTTAPGAATAAWGFADSAQPLESAERTWQEAQRLGPTDLAALRPLVPGAGGKRGRDDDYAPESLAQPRVQPLTLYGRPTSVNVQKALWAIEEVGVPVVLLHASAVLGPGRNEYTGGNPQPRTNTAEYLTMNPNALVPVFALPGVQGDAIFESNAIIRYVARRHSPGLLCAEGGSGAEAQSTVDKWMDWVHAAGGRKSGRVCDVQPICDHSIRLPPTERSRQTLETAISAYTRHLAIPDAQLRKTAYLAGGSFTAADVCLGPLVCRYKVALEAAAARGEPIATGPLPGVDAWFERLLSRPAFVRAVYDPERLHVELPATAGLPEWHRAYLAAL